MFTSGWMSDEWVSNKWMSEWVGRWVSDCWSECLREGFEWMFWERDGGREGGSGKTSEPVPGTKWVAACKWVRCDWVTECVECEWFYCVSDQFIYLYYVNGCISWFTESLSEKWVGEWTMWASFSGSGQITDHFWNVLVNERVCIMSGELESGLVKHSLSQMRPVKFVNQRTDTFRR